MLNANSKWLPLIEPDNTPIRRIFRESKSGVFSRGRGFIGVFDETLQLQVGCQGGCSYCYVPASPGLTPNDMRRNWGFEVRWKRRAAEKFRRQLSHGRLADKTIYWSGVTDPYVSKPRLTRSIWRILNETELALRPRRLAIQSRYAVDRDLAHISEYCQATESLDAGPPVVVSLSIGTDREEVIKAWERATPSFERRMNTANRLSRAGTFVVVTLSPLGPWNDLRGTLSQLREWGIAYLTVLFFKQENSCAHTPPRFLEYLRRDWPFLLDPSWQADRLTEMQEIFGPGRVVLDQAGFSSLAAPQRVIGELTGRHATDFAHCECIRP